MDDSRPNAATPPPRTLLEISEENRLDKMAAIIAGLSKGVTISKMAELLDVERSTIYRWRKPYPEFAEEWDEATILAADFMEDLIRSHAEKDWRAGEAWLRANRRDKWGTHVKTDANVVHVVDELDQLLNAIDGHARPAGVISAGLPARIATAPSAPVASSRDGGEPR